MENGLATTRYEQEVATSHQQRAMGNRSSRDTNRDLTVVPELEEFMPTQKVEYKLAEMGLEPIREIPPTGF